MLTKASAAIIAFVFMSIFASNAPIVHPKTTHPSEKLCVIGVTGTNGKTTVSNLIAEGLRAAGHKTFVLGTLNSGDPNLSTPLAANIRTFMANHLAQGGTHFVLEVTSEGIVEGRVKDLDFDVKLLTNITPDHLDYHGTFEAYAQAKLGFMSDGKGHAIYPDDFAKCHIDFPVSMLGAFNRLNIQAAFAVLSHLKIPYQAISKGLSSAKPIKGRLEKVDKGQPFDVFVDYAHTEDALRAVLVALRERLGTQSGLLSVVFGCGGNRDTSKRPQMGKVAAQYADAVFLTDDNPRFENSSEIIAQIRAGMPKDFAPLRIIPDRAAAINAAIAHAKPGDIVLIAGKGHETQQIVGASVLPFADAEVAAQALRTLGYDRSG